MILEVFRSNSIICKNINIERYSLIKMLNKEIGAYVKQKKNRLSVSGQFKMLKALTDIMFILFK